jgi:hypothetical protein
MRSHPKAADLDALLTNALPRISVADMTKDLALAPLVPRLESRSQKVADTILQAQSECWWAAVGPRRHEDRRSARQPERREHRARDGGVHDDGNHAAIAHVADLDQYVVGL